jgi:hypothetical protein
MFEDIIRRAKQLTRQPFRLLPDQLSELQKAVAIIDSVERTCADERLAYTLNNMLDGLHRIIAIDAQTRQGV